MTRIENTRPIDPKRAIMSTSDEKRYMRTFSKIVICEGCGRYSEAIVPCHLNFGLGGTGYRAKGIVAALCNEPKGCHDILDRRVVDEKARMQLLEKLCQKLLRDRAMAWVKAVD